MTTMPAASLDGLAAAVRLQPESPAVVPITRGTGHGPRTVGVVLLDRDGCRWQRTTDVEKVITVGTVTGGAVAAVGLLAMALRRPRVQRITMGPGGWVSFRGGAGPRVRGPRRPWWAVLLRAHPADR